MQYDDYSQLSEPEKLLADEIDGLRSKYDDDLDEMYWEMVGIPNHLSHLNDQNQPEMS